MGSLRSNVSSIHLQDGGAAQIDTIERPTEETPPRHPWYYLVSYRDEGHAEGPGDDPAEDERGARYTPGAEVQFELDRDGAEADSRSREWARELVAAMRGAGDVPLSTEEILALTRK